MNDDIELKVIKDNNISDNIEIMVSSCGSDDYYIDYDNYCCICMNTFNEDGVFIKFDCCRQLIHKGCFIEMILIGDNIKCPICRYNYNFKEIRDKVEFIDFLKILDTLIKSNIKLEIGKVNQILHEFYKDPLFDYLIVKQRKKSDCISCLSFLSLERIIHYILCILIVLIMSSFIFILDSKANQASYERNYESNLNINEYYDYGIYN